MCPECECDMGNEMNYTVHVKFCGGKNKYTSWVQQDMAE